MKLSVAVIGCGDQGTAHAVAWAERDDAEVVAVYDPLEDRAARVADIAEPRTCLIPAQGVELNLKAGQGFLLEATNE